MRTRINGDRGRRGSVATDSLIGTVVCMVLFGAIAGGCYAWPKYKKYARTMQGEAELAGQEYERRIQVEDARARKEAAVMLAEAEVERARGVAEANQIIAEGLGGPEGYLRYLWIQGLQDGTSEVIYVPTEAGLPILEAGKR